MAQQTTTKTRSAFVNRCVSELRDVNRSPIYGYQDFPVLTIEKSIESILPMVPSLKRYVEQAKANCTQNLTDLTLDESAAIYLYTMTMPFFSTLNKSLRDEDRHALKPWFAFLKLFLTALEKLPSLAITVWRAVSENVNSTFMIDSEEIWWSINSCSKYVDVVGTYIGDTGTIFAINAVQGKDISLYSAIKDEGEVVLMPGTRLTVMSQRMSFKDHLFIVHLHEKQSKKLSTVKKLGEQEETATNVTNNERRKLALIIGNDQYQMSPLLNCVNDANDLSNELKSIGFIVTTKEDLNSEDMDREIRNFIASIKSDDLVLFYFAGHGVQCEDQNFLIPCDEDRIEDEIALKYRATNAQHVLERMSVTKPFVVIYLLDCCREYWLPNRTQDRSLANRSRGMAPMKTLAGSVIAFACEPGKVAQDKAINGRNGVFTYHLLRHITKPGENILLMMTDVTNDVANETEETQIPYVTSMLRRRDVYLVPPKRQELSSNIEASSTIINEPPSFKYGAKFGGSGGSAFDDSSIEDFTCSYYLRGFITGDQNKPLEWCQFLYSPLNNPETVLESDMQGTRETTDVIQRFCVPATERINRVEVIVDSMILYVNNIKKSVPLIRGLRLFATNGQSSRSINHLQGKLYTEQFDGYTVRYVTGRSGLYVDQLQFHWYRNITT